MRLPKVLFFIAGMNPTKEESEAADKIGDVAFRNATAVSFTDKPEACDAVAGRVPPQYAGKPAVGSLEQVIKLMKELRKGEQDAARIDVASGPKAQVGEAAKVPAEGSAPKVPAAGWSSN